MQNSLRLSIAGLIVLATAPADARQPTPSERGLVGRYYISGQNDERLCTATLSFEPSVGGEVQATGCSKTAPELAEGLRWWVGESGGPTFESATHTIVAQFSSPDGEGPLIARLSSGRDVSLERIMSSFVRNPGSAVPSRWAYNNAGGDDPTGGCAVRFGRDGSILVAPRCPNMLRAVSGGRWRADVDHVTLTNGASRLVLEWGASTDTLLLPGKRFRLARQQ